MTCFPRERDRQWAAVWLASPASGLVLLIGAGVLLRLVFAAALGLGIDESYMVAAGRHLQPSYFDHPPLSWWLAWAAAHLAGSEAPVVVRLPFILLFALATWLMYRLTALLFDSRAGLSAAIVMNLAPVLGVTSASWVLPDGPLYAGLLGAALCLAKALPATGRAAWSWWLGAGIGAGLALLSKYSTALALLGALLFLLSEPGSRRWLGRPHPYVAAALAIALFLPVLAWNARHGWVSFRFQGARVGGRLMPFGPLLALAGAALYFLPWIWLPLIWCGFKAWRRGPAEPNAWLCLCLAAPPIVLFTLVALWSRVLFHWAAPGYLFLVPLLGGALEGWRREGRRVGGWLAGTAVLVVFAVGIVAAEVRFNWLPRREWLAALGRDPLLAIVDWTPLEAELGKRGFLDRPGLVVAAIRWLDAGKIDYALGGRVPVLCLGPDPRQYGIVAPLVRYAGRDVLIIAPGRSLGAITAQFGGLFTAIRPLPPVDIRDAGRAMAELPLFIGFGLRPPTPAAGTRGRIAGNP